MHKSSAAAAPSECTMCVRVSLKDGQTGCLLHCLMSHKAHSPSPARPAGGHQEPEHPPRGVQGRVRPRDQQAHLHKGVCSWTGHVLCRARLGRQTRGWVKSPGARGGSCPLHWSSACLVPAAHTLAGLQAPCASNCGSRSGCNRAPPRNTAYAQSACCSAHLPDVSILSAAPARAGWPLFSCCRSMTCAL